MNIGDRVRVTAGASEGVRGEIVEIVAGRAVLIQPDGRDRSRIWVPARLVRRLV